MEILSLPPGSAYGFGNRHLGDLVAAIGTPDLDHVMLDLVNREARCCHLTAFSQITGGPPRMLMAIDRHEPHVARRIAGRYLRDYWDLDPINAVIRREPRVGRGATIRMRCDEIDHAGYQRECYSNVRLVERLSFILGRHNGTVRLNLYRDRSAGHFSDEDVRPLHAIGDLLMQVVLKHDQIRPVMDEETQLDAFKRRLNALPACLSPREVEVCAEIVLGRSSDAISVKLGISHNTVLTHRKRAYAKLRITSQNELSKIILC